MAKNDKKISRRQFIINGSISVGFIAAVGAGVGYLKSMHRQNAKNLLRPPGAVNEGDFIYACIKCGLCVQICPVEAISLAGISQGLSIGTPYIDPRRQACDFSCDAMQCVETCPTAALDFIPFKNAGEKAIIAYDESVPVKDENYNPFVIQSKAMKAHTRMGKAKIDINTCLAYAGQPFKGSPREEGFKGVYRSPNPKLNERKASPVNDHYFDSNPCDLCIIECPIGETAIIQINSGDKLVPKVLKGCTGCGVCVMLCPTEPSSVSIEKYPNQV